jgi:hypothetical protein
MLSRISKLGAIAAIATALACGGSDGGGGPGSASGVVRGTIQKQGADDFVVNGVTFSGRSVPVTVDDNPSASDLAALQNGQFVEVRGQISDDGRTGTATGIRFGEDFQGTVTAVGPSSFTVLGVNVTVDANTQIVNSAGAAQSWPIANGVRVEVSGMPDGTGLRATWVKIEDGGTGVLDEAKGFVVNVSGTSFGLALSPGGAPYLNVTSATALPPFVTNGAYVEVHGTGFAPGTPGTITATTIQPEDRGDNRNLRTHLEGLITSGSSFSSFTIRDIQVNGASATFRGLPGGETDLTSANAEFQIGTKVEAEGTFDASGVLQAVRIKLKDGVRLGGIVASGAPASFVLSGLTVVTDGTSAIEGTIAPAAYVEARGYRRADGSIQAQRVRVRDSGGNRDTYVQGLLTAESPITILGIQVATAAGTEYQDENEVSLGAGDAAKAAFLALTVENRTLVKARWNEGVALTQPAKELEIEAEDD